MDYTERNLQIPYTKSIDELLEQGMMTTEVEFCIRKDGYNGSTSTLRRYCSNWKKCKEDTKKPTDQVNQLYDVIPRNQILKLLFHPKEKIKAISENQFKILFETYPSVDQVYQLIRGFHDVFNKKCCDVLYNWIVGATRLGIGEINSFINGIERDLLSVENAVKYEYSNGLAEGSVNKLKVIKRIMYGRCNFNTLKQKVLRLEEFRKSYV